MKPFVPFLFLILAGCGGGKSPSYPDPVSSGSLRLNDVDKFSGDPSPLANRWAYAIFRNYDGTENANASNAVIEVYELDEYANPLPSSRPVSILIPRALLRAGKTIDLSQGRGSSLTYSENKENGNVLTWQAVSGRIVVLRAESDPPERPLYALIRLENVRIEALSSTNASGAAMLSGEIPVFTGIVPV